MPVMIVVAATAQTGPSPSGVQAAAAAIWTRLAQFSRKKLPMALKMGFQKQPMKQ